MGNLVESLRFRIQEPDRALHAELEAALHRALRAGAVDTSVPVEVLVYGPNAPIALGGPPALAFHARADQARRIAALRAHAAVTAAWPSDDLELSLAVERVVEKAQLEAEVATARRDLEALSELSESLITTTDISGTLLQICRRVAEVMRADRCSIILLDDEAMRGFVVAASDDSSLKDHRIDIAKYPEIREVVRTGAPLVIDDVQRAPLFDAVREEIRDKPVACATLFPVRIDHRVQGVLMLRESRVRARGLDDREIRFGRIVANATAIAIRNARLYEMIRDTSERRLSERLKAERRLRQIEKYQRFFDLAGDGLMIIDGTARILFANRAALAILGFDAAAVSQITLHDIVEPKGREALHAVMQGVQSGVHQLSRDLPVVRASGEVAILSLTTASLDEAAQTGEFPVFRAKDAPAPAAPPRSPSYSARADVTAIISFRDVTATRAMQEELRRTKDFLLNLIESSADAIVAADIKGKILLFNKVAERITGYSAAEAIGQNVAMLYPPGVARDIMRELRATGERSVRPGGAGAVPRGPEGEGVVGPKRPAGKIQDRRQSLLSRTGERIPINLAAAIVFDEGREVATVGIFSDLRERLRIEETLQRAQKQLELSERQAAVVELAGAAAHELNQPLTSIIGSVELATRKVPEDSAASSVFRTILCEAERMAEIVRKLGQLTRYETKPYVGVSNIVDLDAASRKGK